MKQNKRKKILINKSFQIKFALFTLIPALFLQLITWISINLYMNRLIERGRNANLPEDHFYYRLMADQIELMENIFLFVGLASIFILVVWAIFISHKIAGPFYRLTYMLNNHDSNLAYLKFRPGDFFPEVADAVRKYVASAKRYE